MMALGLFLMVVAVTVGFFCVTCALVWLLPSQISKIILPARTGYGMIDRCKEKKQEPLKMAFCFVSFIGWFVIYNSAFYGLLGFLSNDWGTENEYGEWRSYRSAIAGMISLWLSILTLVQLEKLNMAYLACNKKTEDQKMSDS